MNCVISHADRPERMPQTEFEVEIVELLASPLHRYEGRPSDGPLHVAGPETRELLEVRAGLGVIGDRHFGKPAHARASITFQSVEALELLAAELGAPVPTLRQTRRNVLLRGADADALVGREFDLGGVRFGGHRAANPCAWMDEVIAPGAHRAMRGRGGVRAHPLWDGVIRLGPSQLVLR